MEVLQRRCQVVSNFRAESKLLTAINDSYKQGMGISPEAGLVDQVLARRRCRGDATAGRVLSGMAGQVR